MVLVAGVNGTGKTTTIGKIAKRLAKDGLRVVLAAGDTFRAAAIEQLQIWGERTNSEVISRPTGSDAAGLAFDAVLRARTIGADVVLIDTAGRLQNKAGLMAELEKIVRVLKKVDDSAPHAVLLVLDATTGQNALSQVEAFKAAVPLTGLVMTKLDGTAKGGILVTLADRFGLPVHFIGVGEEAEDLQVFDAQAFANALTGAALSEPANENAWQAPLTRLALDLGPLLLFFGAFEFFGIYVATAVFMVAIVVSLGLGYLHYKRIMPMPVFTAVLVLVFGGLTLYLHNDMFIKVKLTVLYAFFGLTLIGGLAFRRLFIKYIFGQAFELTEEGWRKLTWRWGFFFLALAVANEIIWRNYSTHIWVVLQGLGDHPADLPVRPDPGAARDEARDRIQTGRQDVTGQRGFENGANTAKSLDSL